MSKEVGAALKKWGEAEKAEWFSQQNVKRSYEVEVLAKLEPLKLKYDVESYGSLSLDVDKYNLFAIKTRNWDKNKLSILITGGLHGYETSGVQGPLLFCETKMDYYATHFNVVVCPCVSPWSYETKNRWNPMAMDPNRCFVTNPVGEEATLLMQYVASLTDCNFIAHFDLHEYHDIDKTIFRPITAARDGVTFEDFFLHDGFYIIGDAEKPVPDFHRAVVKGVSKVFHIAEPDDKGNIINIPPSQAGVVSIAAKGLGLCMGMTNAQYVLTAETYPNTLRDGGVTSDQCNTTQLTVITSGLDHILETLKV